MHVFGASMCAGVYLCMDVCTHVCTHACIRFVRGLGALSNMCRSCIYLSTDRSINRSTHTNTHTDTHTCTCTHTHTVYWRGNASAH